MAEIFNSIFELSLRALLVMKNAQRPLTEEEVVIADFIAVYGTDFGIADVNLHGDNSYKYCELATRRKKMDDALKDLTLRGLIDLVLSEKTGMVYIINSVGYSLCERLESTYAKEYLLYSQRALHYISSHGIKVIRSEILRNSQLNIGRDENA
ncbi:MAG TPA: hypothetical protein PLU75_03115 [Oscillospiraceae bacterium]|nr:hypothetical protein [Oscillospiraceae bacterium]